MQLLSIEKRLKRKKSSPFLKYFLSLKSHDQHYVKIRNNNYKTDMNKKVFSVFVCNVNISVDLGALLS